MKRYHRHSALAASLLALSACSTPAPSLTAAEDQHIDQVKERVKTEPDRTDQVGKQKRSGVAEPQQQRSLRAIAVHPVLNSDAKPNYPPAAIHSPSGNDTVIR